MFYVYQLIDPRTKEVFYIGKGKDRRMFVHVKNVKRGIDIKKNPHKYYKIKQILDSGFSDVFYDVVFTSENEQECFNKEIELIKEYRKDKLTNITDGGEGSAGYKRTEEELYKMKINNTGELNPMYGKDPWNKGKHDYKNAPRSEESKKRTSVAIKNSIKHKKAMKDPKVRNRISEAVKLVMKNPEIRKKISDNCKGKHLGPLTIERKKKISIALKGKPKSKAHKAALKIARNKRTERERQEKMKFN